jgi:hypothetical protein
MSNAMTGKHSQLYRPLSAWLLAIVGASMILIGAYFIFVRPPLLSEDLRYMGTSREQLQAIAPKLVLWLGWVFTVLGGYVVGTGVLLVHLALGALADRKPHAALVATLAGSFTIGLMSVVNLVIDSDFKFVLLALAAVWVAALVCYGRKPGIRSAQ